ncbi:excisionase family DNA-binding protein [Nesterenkonia sphaerica]|uniref:Helix-turn-helix domain-containing protein n=1 Tax=Nesterenkonia sphaerica TaxID=1804988 RepID=A0A5R9A5K7_9MICC|nr:excisionase family DNA-binding protein [Nesterenkonia sphaerica]TLP73086.1 helix-turn-helix domain-containing protein [Nesterenkonia sphaerica]
MSELQQPDQAFASPAQGERENAAQVLSFLQAHEARHGTPVSPGYFLSGADEHDRIELTEHMHQMLKGIAEALSKGRSVSVLARDHEITTQQAAQILGLSRPTVVRLIDEGELEASVPGKNRRKLKLADVLSYREQLHARRSTFVEDSSAAYADIDENQIPDLLAQARKSR